VKYYLNQISATPRSDSLQTATLGKGVVTPTHHTSSCEI